MSLRHWFAVVCLIAIPTASWAAQKPNIIVIVGDDK